MMRTKLLAALISIGLFACSTSTPTNPTMTTTSCTFGVAVGPTRLPCTGSCSIYFPSMGGSSIATVSTTSACTWTVVSDASWITGTPLSATGSGTVAIAAGTSPDASRAGHLVVAGTSIGIGQAGSVPCRVSVAPMSVAVPAAGGAASVNHVPSSNGCTSTVRSNVSWITVPNPNVIGDSVIRFSVSTNPGGSPERSGTVIIEPCDGLDGSDCETTGLLPRVSVTVIQAGST